jgi:hypothetical protein
VDARERLSRAEVAFDAVVSMSRALQDSGDVGIWGDWGVEVEWQPVMAAVAFGAGLLESAREGSIQYGYDSVAGDAYASGMPLAARVASAEGLDW